MFAASLALWAVSTARAEPPPAVALVVAVDVSQSVDDGLFALQMEGIAAALEDPGVIAAMTGRPGGTLFAMVTWADQAGLAMGWQRIASRADALAAAARVRATPRQSGEFTCLGQMFRTVAASVIPAMPLPAERIVVDVSGDGIDNCTIPTRSKRSSRPCSAPEPPQRPADPGAGGERRGRRAGAYRAPGYGLRATPLPQERTDLAQWYPRPCRGWARRLPAGAAGYGDFAKAIRRNS